MDGNLKDVRCSVCGKATMPGTLRDSKHRAATPVPQTWMPRVPDDGSLLGKLVRKDVSASMEIPLVALRCVECGHVDLFAPKPL